MAVYGSGRLMIRGPRTIAGEEGFIVSGRDLDGKKVSLWAPSRKSAEHIRDKIKAGEKIVDKDYFEESAQRDYKKEYAKFQSSPQKKKYRAELNKYNRRKGTYGNGDGKDASHKSGKISGYEAEGKNRGRREKSRLKGSKRKTEGVAMPTLREFIIREANAELDERLSKRWNIVDSVGPSWGGDGGEGGSGVNAAEIKQAAQTGDLSTILQSIKQVVSLRRKGTIDSSSDDTLKRLLRIFIHVRKNNASVNEGVINELTKAQDQLIQRLRKGGSGWQDLLGTSEERAASQLANPRLSIGPAVEYNYAMGQARLTERTVTITEKGEESWDGTDVKAKEIQAKKIEPEPISEMLTIMLTEDPDQPRCSNCTFFESRGGQKGYCGALTQPDVVAGGWCKQWNHWSEAPSSLKPGQSRQGKYRMSKAAAQYTNRAPNE